MTPARFARIAVTAINLAKQAQKLGLTNTVNSIRLDVMENFDKVMTHQPKRKVKTPKILYNFTKYEYPNEHEISLCKQNNKLEAIKSYKMRNNESLLDSKRIIECMMHHQGISYPGMSIIDHEYRIV